MEDLGSLFLGHLSSSYHGWSGSKCIKLEEDCQDLLEEGVYNILASSYVLRGGCWLGHHRGDFGGLATP